MRDTYLWSLKFSSVIFIQKKSRLLNSYPSSVSDLSTARLMAVTANATADNPELRDNRRRGSARLTTDLRGRHRCRTAALPSSRAIHGRECPSQRVEPRILTARAAQGGLIPEPPAMWLASGNVRNVDVDMNVKLARSYCGRQVAGACRPDTWECRPSVRVPAVSVRLVPIVIRHQTYPPAIRLPDNGE